MDDTDAAQLADTSDREAALTRRRIARNAAACVVGREDCADCGDIIPEERREALPACTRCVACQQLEDDRAKRFAR